MADNEQRRAGYGDYIKAHREDAKAFGIKEPHRLTQEQLVLVALEKNQGAVYLFNEVMTAGERGKLKEYISTLDLSHLPDVKSVTRNLKDAADAPLPAPTRGESYLRLGELARRWHYSKQGVQKLARRPDFPVPRITLNQGKAMRIWAAADIETYERDRPELHSEAAKIFKVRGFARALRKGRPQPSA